MKESGNAIILDHIDKKTSLQQEFVRERFRNYCLEYDYFASRPDESTFMKEEEFKCVKEISE
jgi:hypothetical protein